MSKALLLLLNLLRAVLIVLKPNGTKSLIAENIAPRQQLITIQRKRKRAPTLPLQTESLLPFWQA